ncbi:MAG: BolA family transcriptional regulator [Rhodospirillaceae bacterium]|nr:BolA family transcriptional regulator [Rhodospirillaceae bacterium]|tara:strand:- start:188 stop:466 length:279 start_codon:yes stop_codon:yes gene_type:complete
MTAHSEETIANKMVERLIADLSPSVLKIEDVSWQHAGHSGAPDGGQSHFNLQIAAPALQGLSRVAAHRMVTSSLADFLAGPVHALQITIIKE